MTDPFRAAGRRVFLSFAGYDRPTANKFADDLRDRGGLNVFLDERGIAPGEDSFWTINNALGESDYFVLLWSSKCLDRPYVLAEVSAAFTREMNSRRALVFIVRIDDSELPTMLAPRKFLDAFEDWYGAVDTLIATWRNDTSTGVPLLPPPRPRTISNSVEILVRNQALEISHTVRVPESGEALLDHVRATLALPDEQTTLGGKVGTRFSYRLLAGDQPLSDGARLADGALVDLEIRMRTFGPDGTSVPTVYRGNEPSGLPAAMIRTLVNQAFSHLLPRRRH